MHIIRTYKIYEGYTRIYYIVSNIPILNKKAGTDHILRHNITL